MAANNLRAGATSFTPGGSAPPTQDSFTEYTEMTETIEADIGATEMNGLAEAMNNTGVQASPAPVTGLPAHMVKHAAEFWFPECRDCSCCKGFKHGCSCASANTGVCRCSPQTQAPAAPQNQAPKAAQYNRAPAGQQPSVICKFFLSPNGCRNGNNCRFAHS
jgi:hypothetical protein